MAEKDIIMASQGELKRLHIVQKVFEGSLKQTEEVETLSLSIRQMGRTELSKAERMHAQWSKGFVCDALSNGRPIRLLLIIDVYTLECPRTGVDIRLAGIGLQPF